MKFDRLGPVIKFQVSLVFISTVLKVKSRISYYDFSLIDSKRRSNGPGLTIR